MNEFCFYSTENCTPRGIADALSAIYFGQIPVIVCVGTDSAVGDSLGPLCGTLICEKSLSCYVYGTLSSPVTAKEVAYIKSFVEGAHPTSRILTIDAAVGNAADVGLIKVAEKGLRPGLGANKNLPMLGDSSIIGIVAPRSKYNYSLLNLTRLSLIYNFAKKIADGIALYIRETQKNIELNRAESSFSTKYFGSAKIENIAN